MPNIFWCEKTRIVNFGNIVARRIVSELFAETIVTNRCQITNSESGKVLRKFGTHFDACLSLIFEITPNFTTDKIQSDRSERDERNGPENTIRSSSRTRDSGNSVSWGRQSEISNYRPTTSFQFATTYDENLTFPHCQKTEWRITKLIRIEKYFSVTLDLFIKDIFFIFSLMFITNFDQCLWFVTFVSKRFSTGDTFSLR